MSKEKIQHQKLELNQRPNEDHWVTAACKSCKSQKPHVQAWQRAIAAIEDTPDIFDELTMAER